MLNLRPIKQLELVLFLIKQKKRGFRFSLVVRGEFGERRRSHVETAPRGKETRIFIPKGRAPSIQIR